MTRPPEKLRSCDEQETHVKSEISNLCLLQTHRCALLILSIYSSSDYYVWNYAFANLDSTASRLADIVSLN